MASNWNLVMDGISRVGLNKRESQVFAAIVRKTLGWRRVGDRIAVGQLVDATGLDRRDVSKTLDRLVARRVIVRSGGRRGAGGAGRITVNLRTDEWLAEARLQRSDLLRSEPPSCGKSCPGVTGALPFTLSASSSARWLRRRDATYGS